MSKRTPTKYTDARWLRKRNAALERDNYACVNCGSDELLEVHHKRYRSEIWNGPLEDLQTLCHECHNELGEHSEGGVWWEDGGVVRNNWMEAGPPGDRESDLPQPWKDSAAARDWFRVGRRIKNQLLSQFINMAVSGGRDGDIVLIEVKGEANAAYLQHGEVAGPITKELKKYGRFSGYRVAVKTESVRELSLWDREVLEALAAAPERAAEWVMHDLVTDADSFGHKVTADLIRDARDCITAGLVPSMENIATIAGQTPRMATLASVTESVAAQVSVSPDMRIGPLLYVLEREAEDRKKRERPKAEPLSDDDEAAILEELVRARIEAQQLAKEDE